MKSQLNRRETITYNVFLNVLHETNQFRWWKWSCQVKTTDLTLFWLITTGNQDLFACCYRGQKHQNWFWEKTVTSYQRDAQNKPNDVKNTSPTCLVLEEYMSKICDTARTKAWFDQLYHVHGGFRKTKMQFWRKSFLLCREIPKYCLVMWKLNHRDHSARRSCCHNFVTFSTDAIWAKIIEFSVSKISNVKRFIF